MSDLVERLRITSQMINLGERISWGQDTALMDEAAAEITRLRAAMDDVVCGRGMFGLNPADDLKWAVDHLAAALSAYKEAGT